MSQRNVTCELAQWVVELDHGIIPAEVRHEAVRTFVNWLGCAVGGARHETVDAALRAVAPFSGPRTSTVVGRSERLDAPNAALVNGISSHVLDYDDTHLKTIIHPGGPVDSALLALAELRRIDGPDFITSQIAGTEVECRLGNAVYPDHYDRGWHITGTAGVFGSAAACGRAIGLDRKRMQWALGIAATQSSGLREMFGTMTKSFHPGSAARNGMMAALMAEAGFDSSEAGIEANRGWAKVVSDKQDYNEVLGDLGSRWESALNSYKPFACGIVIHPTIDGCLQLREEAGSLDAASIARVELTTAPLVLELTGKRAPKTGLEGKFSVYHAAACALARGDGSPAAFTDEVVNDPNVRELRSRVVVNPDDDIHEAAARIKLVFQDGSCREKTVERAVGSSERPLDDRQLGDKFASQSKLVVGEGRAQALLEMAWQIDGGRRPAEIAAAAVPE